VIGVRGWLAGLLVLLTANVATGQVTYGDAGLELHSRNDGFSAVVGWRNQVRFTTPFTSVPDDAGDVGGRTMHDFRLNRSRLKVEGHLFSKRLTYKGQADFIEERLRDLNVTYAARDWLRVRAGWWKIEYLVERMQSSGSQQLVDRSILDRWFTLGRQAGIQAHGRVGGKSGWGGHYYAGAFRNVDVDAKGGAAMPVWLARYEWSWAGREMAHLEQGDPDATRDLLLTVGTSVVRTEGAYAFYSGAGLGQALPVSGLPDVDLLPETPDRFRTRQYAGDAVMKWRGVSLQGEIHRKDVRATMTGSERTLLGAYVMGGVLASSLWSRAPRPLELTARIAVVDPSIEVDANHQQERVVGATWYFQGHRSKLSADVTRLRYTTPAQSRDTDLRTRVQWEFTF
jgi:hypothetical protein